jgi:uncharacterized protein (TIGR02611 family)
MIPARAGGEGRKAIPSRRNNGGNTPRLRLFKRVGVGLVGGAVTLIGVALIVLPGPAIIVIPVGLSILATEFEWASRLLEKSRHMTSRMTSRMVSAARHLA